MMLGDAVIDRSQDVRVLLSILRYRCSGQPGDSFLCLLKVIDGLAGFVFAIEH